MGAKGKKQRFDVVKAEAKAQALILAQYQGDKAACAKLKIAPNTLRTYKAELDTNPEFRAVYQRLQTQWEGEVPRLLQECVKWCLESLTELPKKDPQSFKMVVDSTERLANVMIFKGAVESRIDLTPEPQKTEKQPKPTTPKAVAKPADNYTESGEEDQGNSPGESDDDLSDLFEESQADKDLN